MSQNKWRKRNEGFMRQVESKQLWEAGYPAGVGENGKPNIKTYYAKNEKGKFLAGMRDFLAALGKGGLQIFRVRF